MQYKVMFRRWTYSQLTNNFYRSWMLPTFRFDLIEYSVKLVASVPQTRGTVSKNCVADREDEQSRMVPACKE